MCRPAGKGGWCGDPNMVWAAADPDRTRIYADVILDKQRFVPDVHFGKSLLYVPLNSFSLTSFLFLVTSNGFPCFFVVASLKMSSKRGRKRNDNLPPNRARDVQRAFRARRAAHLQVRGFYFFYLQLCDLSSTNFRL